MQSPREIPYEIQAKWRKDLFLVCVILAAIGTVAEIVIYLIDASTRTLFLPNNIYRLRFIYIPSSMNLLFILLTNGFLRSKRLTNRAKNGWSCGLIWFLCFNTQFTHYVYGSLLSLPCLAIFVSILFANKKLTSYTAIASALSILLSCAVASTELRKGDPQLLTDMGLALVIMLVSYIGATLLIRYVRQQIDFILQSSKRESELLAKLQLDNLMGIYNRAKMDNVIESLLADAATGDTKLCLAMLDLDHFKSVNDTYGHLCGDQVLLALADTIRQYGTRNIIPCRYGGEEILIILKDASLQDARAFTSTLLSNFRSLRFEFAPTLSVTFSCGLAAYEAGMTRDEWIKRADDNLYKAKQSGRGRVYPSADPAQVGNA